MFTNNMTKEDARLIDLSEWKLSGGGSQGESYTSRTGEAVILKLFVEGFDTKSIIEELTLSKAIQEAGIPCPDCGDFVRAGNRYGIIFKRIPNKKSFCRAIADDPSCIGDMARRLAAMGLNLHSRSAEGTCFKSALEYYSGIVDQSTTADDRMKGLIREAIAKVSKDDRKTLIHGDFHFGNTITDGERDYFIDLGCFGWGNPEFDNSNLYFSCKLIHERGLMDNYHITPQQALDFWDAYKVAYYGPDAPSDEELYEIYKPYLLIRTLFFDVSLIPAELTNGFRKRLLGE